MWDLGLAQFRVLGGGLGFTVSSFVVSAGFLTMAWKGYHKEYVCRATRASDH